MRLCCEECVPCCDFCIYVIHEKIEWCGVLTNGAPIGCKLHIDEEHQHIARCCGYCKDFYCFNVED